MNILHLHPGPDTGGKSMAAKAALEPIDQVRVFVGERSGADRFFFRYPPAELWDREAVAQAYEWADVVVLHNEPAYLMAKLKPTIERPLIVHHHGSVLRKGGLAKWAEGDRLGAVQVVSTLDLLEELPDSVRWLPQIVDVDAMAVIRASEYVPTTRLRVSHAPTSKAAKATRTFVAAQRKLKGLVDWDLISRQTWSECLRRKARSDLYADQLTYGYGANAVEAWAMGLPVIAGAPGSVLARMRAEFDLPFYAVPNDREAVMDAFRLFAEDPDLRAEWGQRGYQHARRFHHGPAFAERFRRYAEQAMNVTEQAA